MSSPYEHIFRKHEEMNRRYASLLGTHIKIPDGIFEYVGCNDLGHPYFSKVFRGRLGKKQFTISSLDKVWLDKILRRTR